MTPTGRRVQPFDDHVGDVLVANRPLHIWQQEAFKVAGLNEIVDKVAPCLVVPDTLFCHGALLKAFVEKAAGRNATLVLEDSRFLESTRAVQPELDVHPQGVRFASIQFLADVQGEPVDIVVSTEEKQLDLPMQNPYLGENTLKLGIPRYPLITIHHWVHLLWANQVVGGMVYLNASPIKRFISLAWAAMRAFSINRWKVLGKLNRIGRGCDIHPTAILEGATLGDGVKVGPYARVLLSNLDDNVEVMAGAQVEFCTIGKAAIVSENSVVRFSVLYPRSVVSQYLLQQSILGMDAVTTGGSFTMDLNFDHDIRVERDGVLHSSGTKFLGAAFGHRCRIGTGFWLASGRAIPNDAFLIRDPQQVLRQIPSDLPEQKPVMVWNGTLVELRESHSIESDVVNGDENTTTQG